MGAVVSLIAWAIEAAVDAASTAAVTVSEVGSEVLASSADAIFDTGGADPAFFETALDAEDAAFDDIPGEDDAFFQEAKGDGVADSENAEPGGAGRRRLVLTADAKRQQTLAEAKRVLESACGVSGPARDVAAVALMNRLYSMNLVVAEAHSCTALTAARVDASRRIASIRLRFDGVYGLLGIDRDEDTAQREAHAIGKKIVDRALRKTVGDGGLGTCTASDASLARVVAAMRASAGTLRTQLASLAHAVQCTQSPTVGTSKRKCTSNANTKNKLFPGAACETAGRRLTATTTREPWVIPFPVPMLCGARGFVNVTNLEDATDCYRTVLRDASIDWARSDSLAHVRSQGSCGVVLMAGSEDDGDEFCSVKRHSTPTRAWYVSNPHGGDRGHYTDTVFCVSLEQATRTLLVAMTTDRPDFDLVRYVYGTNCSTERAGIHRVDIQEPSMTLPSAAASPNTVLSIAALTVALVHLGLFAVFVVVALSLRPGRAASSHAHERARA